jgi:hypothetical protein
VSERGTWVTEFIYCDRCVEAFRKFLEDSVCADDESKYWSFRRLGEHAFAGRISGMFPGEELQLFEYDIVPKLKEMLCHSLRIAVLADGGSEIFTVLPPFRPSPKDELPPRPFTAAERAVRAKMADEMMPGLDRPEDE